jgi:transcriptional regulator with PAS, ATPase and Fis domain
MRSDFFHRLAAMEVTIPPLRARGPGAIAALVTRVLQTHQMQIGRGPTRIAEGAMALLVAYHWPGNLRELHDVVEQAFPFALDADELDAAHLPARVRDGATPRPSPEDAAATVEDAELTIEAVERRHIARVLSETGGNRSRAARILGIARNTLYGKIEAYGLGEVGYD